MRSRDSVAPQPSSETEPLAPQDAADYVKAGPGSWQPLGLVLHRVIGRLYVDEDQAS